MDLKGTKITGLVVNCLLFRIKESILLQPHPLSRKKAKNWESRSFFSKNQELKWRFLEIETADCSEI